jgi:hypothetical protein
MSLCLPFDPIRSNLAGLFKFLAVGCGLNENAPSAISVVDWSISHYRVGGYGKYTAKDINYVLLTAFTAFEAAVRETKTVASSLQTVIHTGYWGCGAYS